MTDTVWLATLLVTAGGFLGAGAVFLVAKKSSGRVRSSMAWLAVDAVFGSSALAVPALLYFVDFPVRHFSWHLQPVLALIALSCFFVSMRKFAGVAGRVGEHSF